MYLRAAPEQSCGLGRFASLLCRAARSAEGRGLKKRRLAEASTCDNCRKLLQNRPEVFLGQGAAQFFTYFFS
ncbi:hypothetical protein DWUX_723 [Desulfovibrio diazotrophicus]|nr:hypothetical protein DWUX_723 [Desulfovibrio diazotrophicus]VVU43042.1 hypothetical protein DWUX_388 [Desulfovibrio diazotrophicus]